MTSNIAHDRDHSARQLLRPLQPFLDDPTLTEIAINRPGELWAKSCAGWVQHEKEELSAGYLASLATALIVFNGTAKKAINSIVLPGGQRGEIIFPPGCIDGTITISIRKHAQRTFTLEELAEQGAFERAADVSFNRPSEKECDDLRKAQDFTRLEDYESELLALKREGRNVRFLERCVLTKRNIAIAGKTGSGKTTFARALIEKVPREERIVTMEEVHELFLDNHPNKVHLLHGHGAGRASAEQCLISCMRLLPDRIFLAEVRGSEAWEYVNSLNTGHPGSITTVHANNAIQSFARLAALVKQSEVGQQLDMRMIYQVLYTSIDVILYFQDLKLTEIFYDPVFAKSKIG